MAKAPGKALLLGPASAPFRNHLDAVRNESPSPAAWSSVAPGFVSTMESFDALVIHGHASEGERQNGKGDYFNDLVAAILENCSGVEVSKRSGVPGLIFPNHNLDVTFPATGEIIEVLVEAKMMGTPRHPGNPKAKAEGRPGSADMLKRCKEGGFKSIDLKAGYGYKLSQLQGANQAPISGDLTTWLRTVKPHSYMVFGVRVVSKIDLAAVLTMANAMTQVVDGVGVVAYRPVGYSPGSLDPPLYELVKIPNQLDLGVVLHRICQDLRAAAQSLAASAEEPAMQSISTPAEQIRRLGIIEEEE